MFIIECTDEFFSHYICSIRVSGLYIIMTWLILTGLASVLSLWEIVQMEIIKPTRLERSIRFISSPWLVPEIEEKPQVIVHWNEKWTAVATYALNKCLETFPFEWKFGCENAVLTFNAETNSWRTDIVSWLNKNGTRDHWICQLNSRYHKWFINRPEFKDPYAQVDYCLEVWADAKRKNRMPRYAFNVRHKRSWNLAIKMP